MRIEVNLMRPNRKISSCKRDEVFRVGEYWYSIINMSDADIKNVLLEDTEESFAEHHILDLCEGSYTEDLIPCLRIVSMTLFYINKETVAHEWASAKVVISAPQ